ncbi:hypothetical protein VTK26DRAFT_5309 [Humicola hyalothermophila]
MKEMGKEMKTETILRERAGTQENQQEQRTNPPSTKLPRADEPDDQEPGAQADSYKHKKTHQNRRKVKTAPAGVHSTSLPRPSSTDVNNIRASSPYLLPPSARYRLSCPPFRPAPFLFPLPYPSHLLPPPPPPPPSPAVFIFPGGHGRELGSRRLLPSSIAHAHNKNRYATKKCGSLLVPSIRPFPNHQVRAGVVRDWA